MVTTNKYLSVLDAIRKGGNLLMAISIIGEIIFFFSLPNLCGCFMCFFSWWVFSKFFLKREVILNHPFSWLFYLSMVLYRYLPLVVTFFEWKPVTYGFENPYETFFGEIILFMTQSLAFYAVCRDKIHIFRHLQGWIYRLGFFAEFKSFTIWMMGFVGIAASIYTMTSGGIEYGDVGGKFIAPISAMRNIPLVMFFPSLCSIQGSHPSKKVLWLYLIFLELFSMTGNSREALVHPLGVYVVLYFLNLVITKTDCRKYIYNWKFPAIIIAVFLAAKVFTVISDAMLSNRAIRGEVSAMELFEKQMTAAGNQESTENEKKAILIKYSQGWDETYVDNFLLNRYCNMRITDETMHYAMRLDGWDTFGNEEMRDFFFKRLWANLPTPVLQYFDVNIDKNDMSFAEGDYLYAVATKTSVFGGFRVASHLAIGLASFGILYFPIQYILLFFSFYLMDLMVYRKGTITYSLAGLAIVFDLVGRFRNANGCVGDAGYLVRGYWQFLLLNWLTFKLAKLIAAIKR